MVETGVFQIYLNFIISNVYLPTTTTKTNARNLWFSHKIIQYNKIIFKG